MKIFNIIFLGLFLICITGTVAAEYSNSAAEDHEALIIEIAQEFEATMDNGGVWYEGADDRLGLMINLLFVHRSIHFFLGFI
jgi:hypothetical protein